MEPFRVLQVIGIMNRAGAESLIMNLYRAVDRSVVQFDFVEHGSDPAVYDDEIQKLGGRIYRCPKFTGKNIIAYQTWWKDFFDLHANEYEVIHGHIGSTASIYLSVAKKYGLYTIAHSHNTNAPLSSKEFVYRILSYPTRMTADYFFGCSKQAGLDRYGKQVVNDHSKFSIMNNAIDTKQFTFNEENRQAVRKQFGIDENQFVVGHVGRFAKAKNHTFLIRIFDEIYRKDQNAVLLLLGSGELKSEIEEQVRKAGLEKSVIFAGVQENVYDYMSAMDILVFPSVFEGLPVTLVEAQTSGLPCLISDHIPEDAVIVTELVRIKKLNEKPEIWAEEAFTMYTDDDRRKYSAVVNERGFDIAANAQTLKEIYKEKSNLVRVERSNRQ